MIEDDEILLDMLEDRNRSAHIYDEQVTEAIFERIKAVHAGIRQVLASVKKI